MLMNNFVFFKRVLRSFPSTLLFVLLTGSYIIFKPLLFCLREKYTTCKVELQDIFSCVECRLGAYNVDNRLN